MTRRLIIDDCRVMEFPDGEWTHAPTVGIAIDTLRRQEFDEVWFDYDMGGEFGKLESDYHSTILPVVDWIRMETLLHERKPRFEVAVIHTANPVGRKTLETALGGLYRIRHTDARIYTVRIVDWSGN